MRYLSIGADFNQVLNKKLLYNKWCYLSIGARFNFVPVNWL